MASKKSISVSWFLISIVLHLLSSSEGIVTEATGGPCGRTPINSAAVSLSPCLGAAGNPSIKVPATCCAKVGALIESDPRCLCAVLLSPLAKKAGIKPAIAIGIPKRCNIRNRPAGKKCGPYIVP